MKIKNLLYMLSLFALVVYGCENVDEPFSIEEGSVPAFVIIETESQAVTAGSSLEIEFQLGQTQREDVTVEYTISGEAVQGEDYEFVSGSPGTVVIEHDSTTTNLDRGSVTLSFPSTAALGTVKDLVFTLESATTESGESLTIGRGDIGVERVYSINGLRDEVEEGTYDYEMSGDFGPAEGTFEISQPAEPIVIDGTPYFFTVSNIADELFGVPVAYAFNITATGSVVGAPYGYEEGFEDIFLNVGGTYDESADDQLIFEVEFQCCGVSGAQLLLESSPSDGSEE